MIEQPNLTQQSSWLLSLRAFNAYVLDTNSFLMLLNDNAIKRLGLYRFPIDPYIAAWNQFSSLIEQRVKTYSNNPKCEVVISTALFWLLPAWATACSDVRAFTKQYCEGVEGEGLSMSVFREVWGELDLRVKCNVGEDSVEELLQAPFYFLEQLMVKVLELTSSLQEKLRRHKAEIGSFTDQAFLNMLSLLEIETRSLQCCLTQLNSIVLNDKDQINAGTTPVIKFNYILRQYDLLSQSQKNFIRKYTIRLRFITGLRAIDKRRKKLQEERRSSILQLIKGEENYIGGLTQYITNVKEPIERLKLLSREEERLLFSSIMEIRTLHENILSQFQKKFAEYEPTQCYAPILKSTIPFFKVYTDYILNAEAAQRLMKELMVRQKTVGQVCRQYTAKTNKLAENQLLQPTFRIARYEMLFQEIIKKTSRTHPDYQQFMQVQATFKKILTQVNDQVDRIIRRMKLNDLDREFATPDFPIYSSSRQFLADFSLMLIRQPTPVPVTLVVLSDLLLVVQEPLRRLLKRVPVDQEFFARREEDNKIYRNMVTVHSDGFLTFTAGSDDLFAGRAAEVYNLLKSITKESGQLVYISVIGTQEIGSTSFAKYTEYVVEVKYLDVKKLLHVRFSTVLALVAEMQAVYQDPLKITHDESLRKSWFNSHKSKTIEARKFIICQIFQRLFNHPLIKRHPAPFLNFLSLPHNFYQLARASYERRISMAQTVTLSRLKRSYLTKREEREAFTILCGTEIKLGRDLFHDVENDEQIRKLKEGARRIDIQVITLDEQEPIILHITEYDTVEDVCNRLSKLRGLRSNRDFRLFHEIGKKELRVLEHEQLITKLFQFPEQPQQQSGLFASLKRWVFPQTHPTLIFKKYYYLPYDIELAEMRKDLVRLRLMAYQVFAEVRDMKYQLTFDEYLLFLAMRIYIDAEGSLDVATRAPPTVVQAVIPEPIFKLKNLSEEEWLQKCRRLVLRLGEEMEGIAKHNRSQLKEGKLQAESVSKQSLYFGLRHLCSQVVLNKIKANPLFGSNLFYVQPHNATYARLQAKGLKVSFNMWLAVSVDGLRLLSPSSKANVLELRYEDIGKTEVFSQAIVLKTAGAIEEEFRLNTYQSFQISQLVKYNQALNDILAHLREDAELNTRVKQYRDQLMQYRSTFNNADFEEPISLIRD